MMPLVTRRKALAGLSVLATSSAAGWSIREYSRWSAENSGASLVLIDSSFSEQQVEQFKSIAAEGGKIPQFVELSSETVRQWRTDLADALQKSQRLEAFCRWDKMILLQGMAREAGASSRFRTLRKGIYFGVLHAAE